MLTRWLFENMPVVSISLTDRNLELLERIQESLGLTGRSESIRACIRSAESELVEREGFRGEVDGILAIVHDSHHSLKFDEIRHMYMEQVVTQIHSHLRNNKCLEVFIIKGDAKVIKGMLDAFYGGDNFEHVRFVTF